MVLAYSGEIICVLLSLVLLGFWDSKIDSLLTTHFVMTYFCSFPVKCSALYEIKFHFTALFYVFILFHFFLKQQPVLMDFLIDELVFIFQVRSI